MVRRSGSLPPPRVGDDDLEVLSVDDLVERASHPAGGRDLGGLPPDRPERERKTPWWRRRVTVLLASVVVVGAVAIPALSSRGGRRDAVRVRVPDAGTSPAVTGRTGSALGPTVRALGTGPFVAAGREGVLVVDPRHGTTRPVAGRGDVIDRNGDLVLVRDGVETQIVDVTARRPTFTRERVGVFSALEPNRFWIASDHTVQAHDGGPAYILPPDHDAIAAVEGGFLLRGRDGSLKTWNATDRTLRALPGRGRHVVAVRADRVAWTGDDCATSRCNLHLTDVATGHDATLAFPFGGPANARVGQVLAAGRFSPDGSHLAVATPNPNSASLALVVFDLRHATARAAVNLFGALRTDIALDGTPRALPFDWSPDNRSIVAVESSESGAAARVVVIDADSTRVQRSGDALPNLSSVVSAGITPSRRAAPPLPVAAPLAGEPTGVVLVTVVSSGAVERLDVDTGRVERLPLSEDDAPVDPRQVPPDWLGASPTIAPLANGAIVSNGRNAWWVPRTGAVRALGSTAYVLGGDRAHGWLVQRDHGTTILVPVDGATGRSGAPILGYARPYDAVSDGFVEAESLRVGRPAALDVYDPHTGVRTAVPDATFNSAAVAAGGDTVVWTKRCGTPDIRECDDLYVTDVRTRRTTQLRGALDNVSLEPDGEALVFTPSRGAQAGRPQLFDVATRTTTSLPGAVPSAAGRIVWGPRQWMLFATANGFAAWHPGWSAPRALGGVHVDPAATAAL